MSGIAQGFASDSLDVPNPCILGSMSNLCRSVGAPIRWLAVGISVLSVLGCRTEIGPGSERSLQPQRLRVATFNIEDLRTEELTDPESVRARAAAAILQRLRPDVLVLNEIAYDQEGAPGWREGQDPGVNARRFSENFLARSQGQGLEPLRMDSFMAPVNTGIASGFDLDNDGSIRTEYPPLPPLGQDSRSPAGRAYGGDCWGFGTYPGQYAMAILVGESLEIERADVRTFRKLPWASMPGALEPVDPDSGEKWYSSEEWAQFRLASKSLWDIPVRLSNGARVHFLLSHPTPPAFDGPEKRNQKRNHDEIRFWADYLDGADYIVDDAGVPGGLAQATPFVIVGDLNADPSKGRSLDNPIRKFVLDNPRVRGEFVPVAEAPEPGDQGSLDRADTASWGMRVDYVLPSVEIEILGGQVVRPERTPDKSSQVSDHFVVYLDLSVSGAES